MASGGFQLFPPPPPRRNQSPIARRGSKRQNGKNVAGSPVSPIVGLEKSSSGTEAVVIQIVETGRKPTPIELPLSVVILNSRSGTPDSKRLEQEGSHQGSSTFPQEAKSPSSLQSKSPTLGRSLSLPSPTRSPQSPVMMRSMFPTFNPNLRLSQQNYFPARNASPTNLPSQVVQRGEYSPNAMSASQIDTILGGPKTAPASVLDFPLDALDANPQAFSASSDLQNLWDATNGQFESQGSQSAQGKSFNMEMSRSEAATFVFGSVDSTLPFYSIQTFSNNDLTITRHHPFKPSMQVPVMMTTLESQARRHSPYDGLVSLLYPKLAAMLAIDEATELTRQNRLAPDIAEQVAADAVKRAAQLEGCRLAYNDMQNRYELFIPSLAAKNQQQIQGKSPLPQIRAGSPILDPTEDGILHIHVQQASIGSASGSVVGYANSADPIIIVTNPHAHLQGSSSLTHDPATIRTSTLPVSAEDDYFDAPLASLDFSTSTLYVSAAKITRAIPSLYAIDTIVSAVLAVAVADNATNRVMAALPVGVRPERLPPVPSLFGIPKRAQTAGSIRSVTTSHTHVQPKLLVATLAEREDYQDTDDEKTLMSALKSKSIKSTRSVKSMKMNSSSRSKSKDKGKLKTKKIMVAEIDLEKYAEGGDELPAPTRAAISGLFLGLRFVVWMLTAVVELIAWILVKTTRWITSENF